MKIIHTHALVSLVFMDFGFNLEVVLYQICMRDIVLVGWFWERNRLLNCHLISISSVGQDPRKSCVKSLHSHAIESLVSMTLASILEEYCIIFVGGFSFDFYYFWEEIFIPYITTMFHITIKTIYSTFPMSKSS